MKVDLLLRGGSVVTPAGVTEATVAVSGERISAIFAAGAELPEAAEIIDCTGKVVMPGLVDPHVHLGGGAPYDQICETESVSAAIGGATTLLQYRLSRTSFLDTFPDEKRIASEKLAVDTGFHFIISNADQVLEIPEYAEKFGVTTYKHYMGGYPAGNPIGLEMVSDAVLYESMLAIRDLGPYAYCMVHCEDDSLVLHLTEQIRAREGESTLADFAATRPPFVEEQDILRAIWLAELTDCPLYIVHTTIGAALEPAAASRRRGNSVILETCPHYLGLTIDDERLTSQGPGVGKVSPPLRTRVDQDSLWHGLSKGDIATVGTDHVPIRKTGAALWEERPGFAGLAVALPVMITLGVLEDRIDLVTLSRLMSEAPAKLFGYYPRKGAIQPGSDADLVVVDMESEQVVGTDVTQSDYTSAFEGMTLKGWPIVTVRRGEVLFRGGQYLGTPGTGRILSPNNQRPGPL